MTHEIPHYSVIRDHAKALLLAGKFISIYSKMRPDDVHPAVNGFGRPFRGIPRMDIYYPLVGGDTRDDVIAHECAHFHYADMQFDKAPLEAEAFRIIEEVEPDLIPLYWGRPDLGEECVVRLADFKRQGIRLPRMSRQLSALTRALSRPKPFRAAFFCLPFIAAPLLIAIPLAVL